MKIVRLLKHTNAIGEVSLILGRIPYIDAKAIPLKTAKILPVILWEFRSVIYYKRVHSRLMLKLGVK